MKRLCLLRHAKSSWAESSLPDFERPLNARGEADAPEIGERLAMLGVHPELLLSSPAKRALRTAEIIAEKLDYPRKNIVAERRIYEAGMNTLLSVLREGADDFSELMIVGHNPGMSELAQFLSGGREGELPTCAALCLDFEIDSWTELGMNKGKTVFLEYPKKH